jgi:hypothetical protein
MVRSALKALALNSVCEGCCCQNDASTWNGLGGCCRASGSYRSAGAPNHPRRVSGCGTHRHHGEPCVTSCPRATNWRPRW